MESLEQINYYSPYKHNTYAPDWTIRNGDLLMIDHVHKCLSCGYTDDPPRLLLTKVIGQTPPKVRRKLRVLTNSVIINEEAQYGYRPNYDILVDVYELPAFMRKRPDPRYWVTSNFCSYCMPRISVGEILVSPKEPKDAPA